MSEDGDKTEQVETLLATPDLASALESEQFRRFLDQIPIAIVVSEMKESERIVYANPEFEKLSGQRDRKSTRLNSSHSTLSRMPSSA